MTRAISTAVIGPGAIGGAVAGALAQVSEDGLIICSRSHFDRLIVEHPNGRVDASVTTTTDPSDVGPVDLAILAVKAHQTTGAGPWLSALVGPDTVLVVAQNGVEHRARVEPYVPAKATVVPAVVWCPAERHGAGHMVVTGPAVLSVPTGPGADLLGERLEGSYFTIRPTDRWLTRAWEKLMMNAASGGLGVLTGRSGRDLGGDPVIADLLLQLMNEVASVGRAEGADIADDRAATMLEAMANGGSHVSSIVVDRLTGRPTEWDARNAVVGRLAERHGIDVPLNRWITALIKLGEPDGAIAAD